MLLTQDIIRKLIKEEIQDSLNLKEGVSLSGQDLDDKIDGIVGSLGNINQAQQIQILRDVEKKLKELESPANRRDIDEACGDMQSIDMGVDHHDDDHEGSMAKRQMFKTYEYAADVYNMIQDGDEFPAWIQSKMTKIADYIGAVKHYLEYDHIVSERELTKSEKSQKEKLAKKYKPAMESFKDQYGEEGESVYYATMTKKAKEGEKA
jgi:hypothetical protein